MKLRRIGNSGSIGLRDRSRTGAGRPIWSVILVVKKAESVRPPLLLSQEADSLSRHSRHGAREGHGGRRDASQGTTDCTSGDEWQVA